MTRFVRTLIGAATGFALAITAACSSSSSLPAGYDTCKDPSAICVVNGTATCTDLSTTANCGACGNACATPGQIYSNVAGTVACTAGACVPGCQGGGTICGVGAASGSSTGAGLLCTDTKQDPNNCGGCGTICKTSESCKQGVCTAGSIDLGTTLCGGTPGAPIYKNLNTDPDNCGACGAKCGDGIMCKAGVCVACPVAACADPATGGRICVDTQNDPSNCGSCGHAAGGTNSCVNGVAIGPPVVSAPGGTRMDDGTFKYFIFPGNPTSTLHVQVTSAVRIAHVLATQSNYSSSSNPGPWELKLVGTDDLPNSTWALEFTDASPSSAPRIPFNSQPITVHLIAYDEVCYLDSGANGGTYPVNCAGHVSAPLDVTLTVVSNLAAATAVKPAVTIANVTSTVENWWVPLNGPQITLKSSLQNVLNRPAGIGLSVEFRTGLLGAPSASSVPINAPNGGRVYIPGTANFSTPVAITVSPADLGVGKRSLWACPVDFLGLTPEDNGSLACSPTSFDLTIGAIPPEGSTNPPILARGADGTHSIWLEGANNGNGACPVQVQPWDKPTSDVNKIGKATGGSTTAGQLVLCGSLWPMPEKDGVVAIRAATTTWLGTAVTYFDAGASPVESASWIKAPTGTTWSSFERNTISGYAIALDDQNGNLWFAAPAAPPSSDAAPAFTSGTPVAPQVPDFLGTQRKVSVTGVGSLLAYVRSTSTGALLLDLFDPTLAGNAGTSGDAQHLKIFKVGSPTGTPVATPTQLSTFPSGAFVWEWTDDKPNHFLGAAWFDGTNFTQLPFTVSYGTTTTPAMFSKYWIEPIPGVLVGALPVTISPDPGNSPPPNYEVVVVDLTKNPATFTRPVPFNGRLGTQDAVGTLTLDGVEGIVGRGIPFTVSDDGSKVLFKTTDTSGGNIPPTFSLYVLDVATGVATKLYRSAYINDAVTTLPHFLRGTPSYTSTSTGAASPVAIWGELLPVKDSKTHLQKIWFQSMGGATSKTGVDAFTPFTYNRSGTSSPGNLATSAAGLGYWESLTANGVFFLTQGTTNDFDLSFASFTDGKTKLVAQGVAGFRVREDKKRLLFMTSEGLVRSGTLAAGGATGLVTIAEGGFGGMFDPDLSATWGLTPDGDHAWYLSQPQVTMYPTTYQLFDGVLVTIDLATGARTNWGHATWALSGNAAESPLFLAANTLYNFDFISGYARDQFIFWGATQSAPLNHVEADDVGYHGGAPPSWDQFTSVDGNEAILFGWSQGLFRPSSTSVPFFNGAVLVTSPPAGPTVPATLLPTLAGSPYGQKRLPLFSAGSVGGKAWAKYWGGAPAKDPVLVSWDSQVGQTADAFYDSFFAKSADELLYRFTGPDGLPAVMQLQAPSRSSWLKGPIDPRKRP